MNFTLPKIDKNIYLLFLFGSILLETLSFLTFLYPELGNIFSAILLVIFLFLTIRDLSWGILAIFAELVLGVYGYLFVFDISELVIPIRYVLFIVWLSIWLVWFVKNKGWVKTSKNIFLFQGGLIFLVILGIISGFLSNNSFANIFFDSNGWFFWLYFLPFSAFIVSWKKLWPLFMALTSWLAIKTIILEFIFSHKLPDLQWWIYHWLRDFRLAEITPITGSLNRVFFQGQIFLILPFFILLLYVIYTKTSRKQIMTALLQIVVIGGLFISYSRSFWLGKFLSIVIFLFFTVFIKKDIFTSIKKKKAILVSVALIFSSLFLVWTTINFPYPERLKTDFNTLLTSRFGQGLSEPAANARLTMLPPLWEAISRAWYIGSGFGTVVKYNSTDPRLVATSAGQSGEVETYAFEWGYLDIWLKLGLVGLVIYLLILSKICIKLFREAFGQDDIFLLALALSFFALLILNITTPYLNHPLGIGMILLILILSKSYQNYEFNTKT